MKNIIIGAIPYKNHAELDNAINGLKKLFGVNLKGFNCFKYDIDRVSNIVVYHSYVDADSDIKGLM